MVKVTWPIRLFLSLRHPIMYSDTIYGDPSWFSVEDMLQTSFFVIEVKGQGQDHIDL